MRESLLGPVEGPRDGLLPERVLLVTERRVHLGLPGVVLRPVGAKVLDLVGEDDYANLAKRVSSFAATLQSAIADAGLFALAPTQGPMVGLYLGRDAFEAPRNFTEAKVLCENGLYRRFFHEMLDRGVALAPGAYEIMFVSLAHSAEDLERTTSIAHDAAKACVHA